MADFPKFTFTKADDFSWQPKERTVSYNPEAAGADLLLLHELAHATLGHIRAASDVELLKLEAEAWARVKMRLAPKYGVKFNEDFVRIHMDTYRNWLHTRSLCPKCDSTGWQIDNNRYRCPNCLATWRVNPAKHKRIKRVLDKK